MHYVNVKIIITHLLFPCSNRHFTEDQIDLQFHNGESEWFSFLLRFFLFLLRRRLCSISFFLKNMNNNSSFNVSANKKNINVLHTKRYIVFNFTKYPGQVLLWSHPASGAPTFQNVYCYKVHTRIPHIPAHSSCSQTLPGRTRWV